MGKHSKKIFTCKILLSITNQFYNEVVQNIKDSDFAKIISEQTNNNAKVIGESWDIDRGILGQVNQAMNNNGLLGAGLALLGGPLTFVAGASWTNATIIYSIEVDLYNLIKDNSNVVVAQLSKLFKKKREREVMNTMKEKIKSGFEENIRNSKAGVLSPLVVAVKNVNIY
tara:strand:+ start:3286 stop:3795 length:510 start_codon:yes stop_codon:yes gene_type:complete